MKNKAKAKSGSIAAEIQRATLRLERSVALFESGWYHSALTLRAAERVGRAKDRAFMVYGKPRAAVCPHAVERALRDANAAITRAYPLFANMR